MAESAGLDVPAAPAWARWVAVAGGLGYAPVAPGTVGSLLGALLFVGAFRGLHAPPIGEALGDLGVMLVFGLATVLLGLLGVYAADAAGRAFGRADDPRIVIDEVVGQLIALSPLLWLLGPGGEAVGETGKSAAPPTLFGPVVTGFVLFRLFDVWKPGPIRWADRRLEGGRGVMADDVLAGGFAAVCLPPCIRGAAALLSGAAALLSGAAALLGGAAALLAGARALAGVLPEVGWA